MASYKKCCRAARKKQKKFTQRNCKRHILCQQERMSVANAVTSAEKLGVELISLAYQGMEEEQEEDLFGKRPF